MNRTNYDDYILGIAGGVAIFMVLSLMAVRCAYSQPWSWETVSQIVCEDDTEDRNMIKAIPDITRMLSIPEDAEDVFRRIMVHYMMTQWVLDEAEVDHDPLIKMDCHKVLLDYALVRHDTDNPDEANFFMLEQWFKDEHGLEDHQLDERFDKLLEMYQEIIPDILEQVDELIEQ